jgi:hypothetical protein
MIFSTGGTSEDSHISAIFSDDIKKLAFATASTMGSVFNMSWEDYIAAERKKKIRKERYKKIKEIWTDTIKKPTPDSE